MKIIFTKGLLQVAGMLMALAAGAPLMARDVWKEVAGHNASISVQEREWKFSDMSHSPFAFYRATAHLFYKDIADKQLNGPQGWEDLRTWISGDYHLGNVGFESLTGNQRRFELNDFDEACVAPCHWDLLRFLASLHLIQNSKLWDEEKEDKRLPFLVTNAEAAQLSTTFLRAYRQAVRANVIASVTSAEMEHPTDHGEQPGRLRFVSDSLALTDAGRRKKEEKLWKDELKDGTTEFTDKKDRYTALDAGLQEAIKEKWPEYLGSLDRRFVDKVGREYFKPVRYARRLRSGLGSLGVLKVYILVEGATGAADDNLILEAKESVPPAPIKEGALSASKPGSSSSRPDLAEGQRVSEATRRMVLPADPAEGHFEAGGYSFHVTRIHPLSGGVDLGEFTTLLDLEDYVHWAGIALANAHCRADSRFAPAAHQAMEHDPAFTQELIQASAAYAAQVLKDHQAFAAQYRAASGK